MSVTISPRPIISVMILAGEMPSASARSLTVMPDGTLTGPVGTSASRFGSARGAPRSRRIAGLRPAWASMTTRRLPLGAAPRCGRGARPGWAGRSCSGAAAFAPNARRASSGSTISSAIYADQSSHAASRPARMPPSLPDRAARSMCIVAVSGSRPACGPASAHPALGHRYTPRPGRRRSRSTASTPSTTPIRTSSRCGRRRPQPAHCRTGALTARTRFPPPPPRARRAQGRRSSGYRRAPGWDSACRTR